MKQELGTDVLKNSVLVTPPLTKGKDPNKSLISMIAGTISQKMGISYDPHTLGEKPFEMKKIPISVRPSKMLELKTLVGDKISENVPKGKDIILLDDIFTTGSTLKALNGAIKGKGHNVHNIVMFRNN